MQEQKSKHVSLDKELIRRIDEMYLSEPPSPAALPCERIGSERCERRSTATKPSPLLVALISPSSPFISP